MPAAARPLVVWCAAAVLAAGCSQTVSGAAMRAAPGMDDDSLSPIDVETIMLDQSQMRAITGAGEDLSIIPSMDGKIPVDIEPLVESAPPQCQWLLRRKPDVRTRRGGVPQDHIPESPRRWSHLGGRCGVSRSRRRPRRLRQSGRTGRRLRLNHFRVDVRWRLDGHRRHVADAARRLRSRLPGEIGGAGRGHLLPRSPTRCPTS